MWCRDLHTNILVGDTINYITKQIYIRKKLTPICAKRTFRRLRIKLLLLNSIVDS